MCSPKISIWPKTILYYSLSSSKKFVCENIGIHDPKEEDPTIRAYSKDARQPPAKISSVRISVVWDWKDL